MNERDGNRPIPPIVTKLPNIGLMVDLGQQPEGQIRLLEQGIGELARQVQAAIVRSQDEFATEAAAEIVPVVLLYGCATPDYVIITPQA